MGLMSYFRSSERVRRRKPVPLLPRRTDTTAGGGPGEAGTGLNEEVSAMRRISAGLPLRVLAGIGIVACLALSGGAPAATAPPANATTARTVTAVAPGGAAILPAYTSAPGWLTSVSVVSANNAWADGVGAVHGGMILHWKG